MNPSALLLLFQLVFGIAGVGGYAAQETVRRVVVEHEVILRVPVQPQPLMPLIDWVEHKGPKCIPTAAIRGALLSGEEQVDFLLADRGRVRAQFDEDCPALDFYGGFYLQPADELICANRDAIYSRIGGSCGIHRFRVLIPKVRR
jgi:hypothetical protein